MLFVDYINRKYSGDSSCGRKGYIYSLRMKKASRKIKKVSQQEKREREKEGKRECFSKFAGVNF